MPSLQCRDRSFHNVEAIIFDKDGTLSDSQHYLRELGYQRAKCLAPFALQESALKLFGLTDTLNPAGLLAVGTRQENQTAIAALIAQAGFDWSEALEIAQKVVLEADQFMPRKADLTPPFPGIVELLESLQGFKLAVLSSDRAHNIQDFLARYHLESFFLVQVGAQPGISKPDPRLLTLTCSQLQVSPQNAIVIGDSLLDIELAKTGGAIASIGVTWGGVSEKTLARADAIAHQVSDLKSRNS
jgi:phosphoglycolate phosphatase